MGLFTTTIKEISNNEKVVPVVQTVHEHRAPTDESVRLLNEMQDKVISNIIEQSCWNNILEWFVFQVENDVITDTKNVYWWFKINGKLCEFKIKVNKTLEKKELLETLCREIFAEISNKLVLKILETNPSIIS